MSPHPKTKVCNDYWVYLTVITYCDTTGWSNVEGFQTSPILLRVTFARIVRNVSGMIKVHLRLA